MQKRMLLILFVALAILGIEAVAATEPLLVQVQIISESTIPDPKSAPYPECNYTLYAKGRKILSGYPIEPEFMLVARAFTDRQKAAGSQLKSGKSYLVEIVPYESLTDAEKSVFQADDLQLFHLEAFFVKRIVEADKNLPDAEIPFKTDKEESSEPILPVNPPLPDDFAEARRDDMRRMSELVDRRLAEIGDEAQRNKINADYESRYLERVKQLQAAGMVMFGGKALFYNGRNFYFRSPRPNARFLANWFTRLCPVNLEALKQFQSFLNYHHVQLIVHPLPVGSQIAAHRIIDDFPYGEYDTLLMTKFLLDNGIEAVYSGDRLIDEADKYEFLYQPDEHPAEGAQIILTKHLAEILEKRLGKTLRRDAAEAFSTDHSPRIGGQKFPSHVNIGPHKAGETILCQRVLYRGKADFLNPQAEILVIGNSHIQHPTKELAYPAWLSKHLNYRVAGLMQSGYGPVTTLINRLGNQPEDLRGKKVVILALPVMHLANRDVRFADLRKQKIIDRHFQGRKLMLPVEKLPIPPETNDSAAFVQQLIDRCGGNWNAYSRRKGAKTTIVWPLPEEISARQSCLCTFWAASANPAESLRLTMPDGQFAAVKSPQYCIFLIPEGQKDVKIEVSGAGAKLFAVSEPTFYQQQDQ